MSRLDDVVRDNPLPGWRAAAWTVSALLAAALAWAWQARLDEVAVAQAEVVPQGQVRVIQHLEGGIVQRIHVAEGQSIEAGMPLVQLDLGAAGVNREELEVQIAGLELRRARLQAEARGTALALPAEVSPRLADVLATEREAHVSRQRQFESGQAVLQSQTQQRQQDLTALEAKRQALQGNLRLSRERLAMSKELLANELVPRMEYLQLESEVESLQGQLGETEAQIPRARQALAEARERERTAVLTFRRAAVEELGQVELTMARTRELLSKATDQERRTVIRSSIDGVVKNLRYHTIGGVVRPGDPIMEIVPLNENLVIEARLNPVDVGYVTAGQPAVVKVTTYDYVRYGGLDGTVVNVAADATLDRSGHPYFKVVVQTDKAFLGDQPDLYRIAPGMQATVDIHTGTKSVLNYLITPVLKLRHEAFRER